MRRRWSTRKRRRRNASRLRGRNRRSLNASSPYILIFTFP
jgi:hypothetical protein